MRENTITIGNEYFLKLDEVAEKLQVSARSVRREIARGRLAKPVKVGGSRRWPWSDVAAYMELLKQERGS